MDLMATVKYRPASPYFLTPQTSWFLSHYEPRLILPDDEDLPFTVPAEFALRPDRMSQHFYGTADLWWVFAVRNMNVLKDPVYDLKAGIDIFIPTKRRVENLIG